MFPLALASNHSDEFYAMATEKGKDEAKKYYASAEKEKLSLPLGCMSLTTSFVVSTRIESSDVLRRNATISSRLATRKNRRRFVPS